jgi:cytochrome c oxidase subunit 1
LEDSLAITGREQGPGAERAGRKTVDHSTLGVGYAFIAVSYGVVGSVLSIRLRAVLGQSGEKVVGVENGSRYNLVVTMHAYRRIFFLVRPYLIGGIGNLCIPLCVGASEVAYPRTNNLSLILVLYSFVMRRTALVMEAGNGNG